MENGKKEFVGPRRGLDKNVKIERISETKFVIRKEEISGMERDIDIYANSEMLERMRMDRTLSQASNAATLPGLVSNMKIMPDGHEGYGFPVGGVEAFDAEEGIISPGAIGFDINCGVRLIKTKLSEEEIRKNIGVLSDRLFRNVPSGVGSKMKLGFTEKELERVCEEGVPFIIDKGYGSGIDIEHTEENGFMEGADFSEVSKDAKLRGLFQLGTLGAGNHFLEVQKVEKIFDKETAKGYGLYQGQAVVMVHTGSRGFGHQICSDYLRILVEYQSKLNIKLKDPELSYARIGSREADSYLGAMKCAVNYAFTNRQIIMSSIMKSFEEVFGKSSDSLGMELLYDVSHNIAKLEEHSINGLRKKVYVHRKGATRAFPKGHRDLPKAYRRLGQPVLIPGSMTTGSYILVGTEGAMEETLGSSCHGAGRVMSRHQAIREIPVSKTLGELKKKSVELRIRSMKLVSEEAEWAYKNIDDVVGVVERAGIAKIVARSAPLAVIKG